MDMLPSSTTSGSVNTDYTTPTFSSAGNRSELTVTEEDVCAMLRSLNEADLKMLESHLGSAAVDHEDGAKTGTFDCVEKVEADTGGDGNLSQYLNDCGRDSLLPLSQTSSGLLDVDEINDGDLLSADIGNMHVILSDLRTPTRDLRITHLPVTSRSNLSALFETNDYGLDGAEFASGGDQSGDLRAQTLMPETSTLAPPELCVVNMFWNDLPGLIMEGHEYVRLVDIHRQVLPAKDTGILKKRCYMLGLEVRQCSELQRDFLIRYMNAAKSKSTVVISRTDAIHLIGFYVTPKSKPRSADADDGVMDGLAETASDLTASGARESQQSAAVSSRPGATQSSPLMTQHDRLSSLRAAPPQAATTTAVQSNNRRHSTVKVSPPDGVKRSERLRDRRVHYADMVHGIHPRHSAADGADIDSKFGETGHQQNSHHTAMKVSTSLPHLESSTRTGGRTSSIERHAKSEATMVDSVQGPAPVNYRRKSMELRSTTDRRMDEVGEAMHPLVTDSSVSSGGRRRISGSGSQQARQEDIPHTSVASNAVKVESSAEQSLAKPATALNRRHRVSTRRRRRMAARRHSKLLQLSSQLANPSPEPSVHTLELNSSSPVINDCSQQKVAAVESHLVNEPKVCSPNESVKLMRTADANVSQVIDEDSSKMLKMDSDVVPNGVEDGAVKTLPNKTSVSMDVSAPQPSCSDGIKSYLLKHEMPLTNLVPVMHVDFANRVGRRRWCSQDGVVLLDRYVSVDAACVRCCSCSQLLSVAEFMRHAHRTNQVGVGSVRRLGPRGVKGPEWHEFHRRRTEFAVGVSSKAAINPPSVDKVTTTATVEDTSPGPAVNQHTKGVTSQNASSAVLAGDEVSKSVENSPLLPAVQQNAVCTDVVKKLLSMPVSGQDTKSTGVEQSPPPVPIVDKVTEVISGDVDVGSCRPLNAAVVSTSCPAAADKTSDVAEPRITRSRRTSVGCAEPSPGVMSLRSQSVAVDVPASASRHHERSCKRVRVDSVGTTPTQNPQNRGGGDTISSRVELRPRPPPRTTAPK